jgi:hypothetical protein
MSDFVMDAHELVAEAATAFVAGNEASVSEPSSAKLERAVVEIKRGRKKVPFKVCWTCGAFATQRPVRIIREDKTPLSHS